MSRTNMKGFDDLVKKAQKAKKELAETTKKGRISFSALFPNSFMRKYTDYESIDEMLTEFGYDPNSQEEFDSIPDAELDEKVSKTTKFKTWQEMNDKGFEEYAKKKLSF